MVSVKDRVQALEEPRPASGLPASSALSELVRQLESAKASAAACEDFELALRLKGQLAEVQKIADEISVLCWR